MVSAQQTIAGDGDLQTLWRRRVSEGGFSAAVVAARQVRVFGGGGSPFPFPQLRAPHEGESPAALLAQLEPDERWALSRVERMVHEHAAAGRPVYAVARDQGVGVPLQRFDPSAPRDILML